MGHSHERRIVALFLADGIQVSALLTTVPFMAFAGTDLTGEGIRAAGPIGAGLLLGAAGTWAMGYLVDRFRPLLLLQTLQFTQLIATAAAFIAATTNSRGLPLAVCLAIGLARSSGPAKDKIRSGLIHPKRRTRVNAYIRSWFLVCNELTVAVVTIAMSLLPSRLWHLPLLITLAGIAASMAVAWPLRLSARARPSRGRPIQLRRLVGALAIIGALGLGAGLPTVGLAAWIAQTGAYPPWLVSVVGVASVLIDFVFIRLLGSLLERRVQLWARMHRAGALLLIVSLLGTWSAARYVAGTAQLALLIFSLICSALAFSVAVMIGMEVQYGFGPQASRGRVSSLTRLASLVGSAASAMLAPGIFLGAGHSFLITLFLAAALLLVPASPAWLGQRENTA